MGSVVSVQPNLKKNMKTLNLVLVGYGNRNAVYSMLCHAKEMLVAYAKCQQISLYSNSTLDKAESESVLLHCKKFPTIRVAKGEFIKDFYGFSNDVALQDLYNYLYTSPSPPPEYQSVDYFSPKGLSKIIHDRFSGPDTDQEETFCDLHLQFVHNFYGNQKSFARIECRISEPFMGVDISAHAEKLKEIIRSLDRNCGDVLQSAYLSFNYPELTIVHNKLYPVYDEELCGQYLLGAEWCVYSSRRVDTKMSDNDREQLADIMEAELLTSGTVYTSKCGITDFTPQIRTKLYAILQKQLIPAYGIYSWSGLHQLSWSSACLPETILVFRNLSDPYNPDIAFSFHYDFKQMMQYSGLQANLLLHGFYSQPKAGVQKTEGCDTN